MITNKIMSSGVVATWSEIVRTEMDYNNKSSKATVYYYLDEQAFLDGKEPVMGEVIDVPYVEQEELEKELIARVIGAGNRIAHRHADETVRCDEPFAVQARHIAVDDDRVGRRVAAGRRDEIGHGLKHRRHPGHHR